MRLIDVDGSYTLNASDNTDYSLCFGGGIISVIDKHGHVVCEFFADDAPTIEAKFERYGHWELSNYNTCQCSMCNQVYDEPMSDSNYCPNCGAKMEAEE